MPRPLAYEEERRLKTGHLVAALALVFLGVLIGWATNGGDSGGSGQAQSADVGPARTVDGVPVGYERSREGAVAAALAYDAVLARPEVVTDPARRRAILKAIATPEVVRQYEQEDRVAALASLAQEPIYRATQEGGPSVWQTTPLAYRVERYTEDDVQVSTWSMAITGAGRTSPVAAFGTGSGRLHWQGGDWKFAGEVGRPQDGPTPAPLEGASRTSSEDFRARLRGLEGLHYVP